MVILRNLPVLITVQRNLINNHAMLYITNIVSLCRDRFIMEHLAKKMIPLYLKENEKERLDLYAEIVGISRQKLLEAIISSALDDLDIMDRIDLLMDEVRLEDQLEMFKRIRHEQKVLVNHVVNSDKNN